MRNTFLILFLNISLLVIGQCIWKMGISKIDKFTLINLAFSAYIWLGVILYGLATILWLKVLSFLPLSIAYPIQSLAYVLGMIAAYYVFGEAITVSKIVGSILIIIGVCVISILN